MDDLRAAIQNLNARQDGHAATLAVAGLPSRMSSAEAIAFFRTFLADHPPHAEGSAEAAACTASRPTTSSAGSTTSRTASER